MKDQQPVDVNNIVDNQHNVNLLMQSHDLVDFKLLSGKATKINNLQKQHTGWFSREIAADPLCTTPGGGLLIFKTNPLIVKRIESKGRPSIFANTFAQSFAIENQ